MILPANILKAQFTTSNSFFISANTELYVNGLYIRPSSNTTALSDRVLTMSNEPIKGKPTSSINRVYHFNEPVVFSGAMGVTFDPSELNGNTETDLQIAYFNPEERYVTTTGSTRDLNEHYVSKQFANQSLLRITAVNANSALPVTLVNFQAQRAEQQVLLTWSTAHEVNSDYFEIQRSADGRSWEVLGKVGAGGNVKDGKTYAFHDPSPQPGSNLYRLKMTDLDETYAFSRIIAIEFAGNHAFSAYPNPVHDKLLIRTEDWSAVQAVELISKQGVPYLLRPAGQTDTGNTRSYDCSALPAGIYLISITRKNGQHETQQIFKF